MQILQDNGKIYLIVFMVALIEACRKNSSRLLEFNLRIVRTEIRFIEYSRARLCPGGGVSRFTPPPRNFCPTHKNINFFIFFLTQGPFFLTQGSVISLKQLRNTALMSCTLILIDIYFYHLTLNITLC